MAKLRIFHIDGKRVSIISSDAHTYHVRFMKSGKHMQVYKKYVKTFYAKNHTPKKKTQKKPKKDLGNQQQLKF